MKSKISCRMFLAMLLLSFVIPIGGITGLAQGTPVNLLTNPGFETGDFAGWTIGGNSPSSGVFTDGTAIVGTFPSFGTMFANVRSGTFVGNALVAATASSPRFITLEQTLSVAPLTTYEVGYFVGVDAPSVPTFGNCIGDALGVQLCSNILIDGVPLFTTPFTTPNVLANGSTPADFVMEATTFTTGSAQTSLTATYRITGSGTGLAAFNFDDFFFRERATPVPEPGTLTLLSFGLFGVAAATRRRYQWKHQLGSTLC